MADQQDDNSGKPPENTPAITLTATFRQEPQVSCFAPPPGRAGCFGPTPGESIRALDWNGDGITDLWHIDTNGDGLPDLILEDIDQDGFVEGFLVDEDFDGKFDYGWFDTNGDKVIDTYWKDKNGDGLRSWPGEDEEGEYSSLSNELEWIRLIPGSLSPGDAALLPDGDVYCDPPSATINHGGTAEFTLKKPDWLPDPQSWTVDEISTMQGDDPNHEQIEVSPGKGKDNPWADRRLTVKSTKVHAVGDTYTYTIVIKVKWPNGDQRAVSCVLRVVHPKDQAPEPQLPAQQSGEQTQDSSGTVAGCVPPEVFDPILNRCRMPDAPAPSEPSPTPCPPPHDIQPTPPPPPPDDGGGNGPPPTPPPPPDDGNVAQPPEP